MRFPIKAKLAASSGLILILLAATAYVGVASLGTTNDLLSEIVDGSLQRLNLARNMRNSAIQVGRSVTLTIAADSDAVMQMADADTSRYLDSFRAVSEGYAKLASSDEERQRLKEIDAAWSKYVQQIAEARRLTFENTNVKAADLVFGKAAEAIAAVLKGIDELQGRLAVSGGGSTADIALAEFKEHVGELRLATYQVVLATNDHMLAGFNDAADSARAAADSSLGTLARMVSGDLATQVQHLQAAWNDYVAIAKEVIRLGNENSNAKALAIVVGPAQASFNEAMAKIEARVKQVNEELAAARQAAAGKYQEVRRLLIAMATAAVVVGIAAAAWIGLGISRGLGRVVRAAEAVAVGDLSHRVRLESRDEIGALGQA
ncbi:MCP four helix bundle domain-containing protein, partial [Benzoatithermus flavus]